MLQLYKSSIAHQYGAALATLDNCLAECFADVWSGPIANHSFNQSIFHALFFLDLYLSSGLDAFKQQDFHRVHANQFEGYEELQDRKPTRAYDRSFIGEYLQHCRQRCGDVLAGETESSLQEKVDFPWLDLCRAELHIYNIRHLQHHAAQLILRLRLESDVEFPWTKQG